MLFFFPGFIFHISNKMLANFFFLHVGHIIRLYVLPIHFYYRQTHIFGKIKSFSSVSYQKFIITHAAYLSITIET